MGKKTVKNVAILAFGTMLVAGFGCQTNVNRLRLENYADPEKPEELFQDFSQGYFSDSPGGLCEVLLTSQEPIAQNGGKVLRQAVFVTTLWKPIPGRTYAESSQINARVIYLVEIAEEPGQTVVSQQTQKKILCYKGTGFVSFYPDRTGQELTGSIEQALLEPTHKGTDHRLGTFELSGNFKAIRNKAAVAEFKISDGKYWR